MMTTITIYAIIVDCTVNPSFHLILPGYANVIFCAHEAIAIDASEHITFKMVFNCALLDSFRSFERSSSNRTSSEQRHQVFDFRMFMSHPRSYRMPSSLRLVANQVELAVSCSTAHIPIGHMLYREVSSRVSVEESPKDISSHGGDAAMRRRSGFLGTLICLGRQSPSSTPVSSSGVRSSLSLKTMKPSLVCSPTISFQTSLTDCKTSSSKARLRGRSGK